MQLNSNFVLPGSVLAGAIIVAGTIAAVGSVGRHEIVFHDLSNKRFVTHDRWSGAFRACSYDTYAPAYFELTIKCDSKEVLPIEAVPDKRPVRPFQFKPGG